MVERKKHTSKTQVINNLPKTYSGVASGDGRCFRNGDAGFFILFGEILRDYFVIGNSARDDDGL